MKTSARVNESKASGYELLSLLLLLCKLCMCVWWMCLPAWLFTALPNWIPDVILKSFWWVWLYKANRETFCKAPFGQLPLVSDSCCINWPGPRCSLCKCLLACRVLLSGNTRLMRLLCFLFLPSCPLLWCLWKWESFCLVFRYVYTLLYRLHMLQNILSECMHTKSIAQSI